MVSLMKKPHGLLSLLIVLRFLAVSAVLIDALPSHGQVVFEDTNGKVQKSIEKFMEAKEVPALSLAVTKDDRLVYAQAFGYANCTNYETVTPEYRFRVASVSKTIAAVAIMSLYEQGYFNLTTKVLGNDSVLGHDYGSKPYSAAERAITIQHLLEHSSGFIDDAMGGDPTYQPQWLSQTKHELVGTVLDAHDPSAWPGSNASYSNFGYMILGRIVEKVTGDSYFNYVQEHILKPLGAKRMDIGDDIPNKHEVGYYDDNSTAPYTFHISRRDSVGAVIARPVDLVALLTAINGYQGRRDILKKKTQKLMYALSAVKNSTYAKGWDAVSHNNDGLLIEANKNGGFPGTTAWVAVRANESVTYAVAINKVVGPSADLKDAIDAIMVSVTDWPNIDLFPDYGVN